MATPDISAIKTDVPLDEILSHRWFHLRGYLDGFEAQVRKAGITDAAGYTVSITLKADAAHGGGDHDPVPAPAPDDGRVF